MPANDREVFEYLRADQETPIEIDMLAYAIFANERREWCQHFERQQNRPPNQKEIDRWTSEITDWRFGQMRDEAVQFFDNAARQYLSDEIAGLEASIRQEAIITEV